MFSNLKVAFVHDWLNGMRGGEKVLEQLCRLFPRAPIYTLHMDPARISADILNHSIHPSFINQLPYKDRLYRWYLPLYPAAVKQFHFRDFDLVLSTSHCAAKNVPVPEGTPHLCYCFSPMRYIWELQEEYFGKNKLKHLLLSPVIHHLKRWDEEGAKRISRIIAISKTVQERIQKYYHRQSDIIYPPVDIPFTPSLPKSNYYLVLSALVPYKRIDLAIRACNLCRYPLKVIGSGPEIQRLRKLAGPTVQFLGWVRDEEKFQWLKSAKALLFPGVEDFGIVPLEAMAFATPVIAYHKGGLLETVTEGKTGCFFQEQTTDSLIQAVQKAEQSSFSVEAFRETVNRFSAAEFIEKIKQAIQETVHKKRNSP